MIPYGRRLKYAFRTFFSILDHSRIPDDVADAMLKKEAPTPAAPPQPAAGVEQLVPRVLCRNLR